MSRVLNPGATLGVLGSGQLGRMFAIAARKMGYRVHTFSPASDTPTGQVADVEIDADYDDLDAIRAFARGVDVITFDHEHVPHDPPVVSQRIRVRVVADGQPAVAAPSAPVASPRPARLP